MENRLLRFAALSALAVLGSACGPPTIGDPREADSSNPADENADYEPDVEDFGSRPWAHNTGPSDPGALVPSGGFTISTNGAVVEDLDITGMVTIDADNVTLRNFRVRATSYYGINVKNGHSGIVIEDGEISGAVSTGILGVGYTARRLHIHDCGDGLKVQGSGGDTIVEWSFVEKVTGSHGDAVQTDNQGTGSITLHYNNFYLPYAGTPDYPGSPYQSNAVLITKAGVHDYLLDSNWMVGGNYMIYCEPGITISNNIIGRYNRLWSQGRESEALRTGACGPWTGNRWEDTGDPI